MTEQILQTAITMLIVEDSKSDRATYSHYLPSDSENTYRILAAATLEEGLELCRSQQPDIVLLDLNLPNYMEFLEAIKDELVGERVPLIMLAGSGNQKMVALAISTIAHQQVPNELAEHERIEALTSNYQSEIEKRNELLQRTSEEWKCSLEELRASTEAQIAQNQELEYERLRFQNLFNFAPDGYLVTDSSGRILEANQVVLELFAGSHAFIVGKPLVVFVASDHKDLFYSQLNQLLSSDNIKTSWEITLKPRRGIPFPAEISVIQNINPANNEIQICWIIRNISDRQRTEQELLKLNESLEAKVTERTQELWQVNQMQQSILDGTDYAIISTDLNGIIQTFNAGAEKMLGYRMEEVVGQTPVEIFLDFQEVNAKIAKASNLLGKDIGVGMETLRYMWMHGLIDEEWIHIRKDGSRFPISLSGTILKDNKGQMVGFLTFSKDISDRKQAELLNITTNRLALALKFGAIGCWELDIPQNIIDCDERMYELYGISKETDANQLFDVLVNAIHPEDRNATLTLLQEVILGHAEYDCEFRVIHPDRSIHFIKANGKVVRDNQGNAKFMIGINFDISDRKEAEAKIQQLAIQKQALFFINQSILQVLDVANILNITVTQIREILNLDRVAIYRFQPDWGGEFIVESVADGWVKLIELDRTNKTWDDTYLQETRGGRFRNHESMIVTDIYEADFQPCHIEMLEWMQARAYIITPIFIKGTLWGLMGLYKNAQPYPWQSWEIELSS